MQLTFIVLAAQNNKVLILKMDLDPRSVARLVVVMEIELLKVGQSPWVEPALQGSLPTTGGGGSPTACLGG